MESFVFFLFIFFFSYFYLLFIQQHSYVRPAMPISSNLLPLSFFFLFLHEFFPTNVANAEDGWNEGRSTPPFGATSRIPPCFSIHFRYENPLPYFAKLLLLRHEFDHPQQLSGHGADPVHTSRNSVYHDVSAFSLQKFVFYLS